MLIAEGVAFGNSGKVVADRQESLFFSCLSISRNLMSKRASSERSDRMNVQWAASGNQAVRQFGAYLQRMRHEIATSHESLQKAHT